jgi:hypothetical protein
MEPLMHYQFLSAVLRILDRLDRAVGTGNHHNILVSMDESLSRFLGNSVPLNN